MFGSIGMDRFISEKCYKWTFLEKELLENDHFMVIFLKFLFKIPWSNFFGATTWQRYIQISYNEMCYTGTSLYLCVPPVQTVTRLPTLCKLVWAFSGCHSDDYPNLISWHVSLFACWVILHAFLSSADFSPQNQCFRKILSEISSESQTVWILIRPDILSSLILVQNICKSYQQTTLVK